MSSVLRPVGPEDPSVYWKRRAAALGGLFVLMLILWALFFGGGDSNAGASQPSPSPTPSTSPTASESPSSSPTSSTGATASPTGTATAASCADSAITVTAATDAEVYPAGVNPKITLSIKNSGSTDCVRDIGADANEIIVESGGEHVWSSDDCDASKGSSLQVLPVGETAQTTLAWGRTLSTPGCTTSGGPAQAGTYTVKGRNGTVVSEPVRITLQ